MGADPRRSDGTKSARVDRHAGSRFRQAQRIALGAGLCVSLGAHALLLWRGRLPPVPGTRFEAPSPRFAAAAHSPVIEIPPPPEPLPHPSEPRIPEVEVRVLELDSADVAPPLTVASPPDLPWPDSRSWSLVAAEVPPLLETSSRFARRVERYYTRALRAAELEGVVDLELFVDSDGRVARTRLRESSGHEELDEAAAAIAADMQFLPALQRDKLVGVWVHQRICFTLLEERRRRPAPDACDRLAARRP